MLLQLLLESQGFLYSNFAHYKVKEAISSNASKRLGCSMSNNGWYNKKYCNL